MEKIAYVMLVVSLIFLALVWDERTESKIGVETSGTSTKIFLGIGILFFVIGGLILKSIY